MLTKNIRNVITLALLGVLTACGELGPTAPNLDDVPLQATEDLEFQDGRLALTWLEPLKKEVSVTQTMGLWGGTIELKKPGLRLWVPPYALAEDLEITMSARAGEDVAFDFGPHGTKFRSDVWVSIDLTKVSNGKAMLEELSECSEPTSNETEKSKSSGKTGSGSWGNWSSWNTTGSITNTCSYSWFKKLSGLDGVYMDPNATDDLAEALENFEVWVWGDRWLTFKTDHFSGYALAM